MVRATLRQFLEGHPGEHSPPEAITVTAGDLERYAIEWAWLVPEESAQRGELVAALVERFGQEVLLGRRTTHTLQLTTQPEQQDASTPTLTPRPLPEVEGASWSNPVDVLERGGECIVVKGGETLLRQGELSADFYVVLTGRLAAAQATDNGGERVLREMVRGTSIGELAALTGQPRAARVFAMRDSHLLRVPREAFEVAVARHPEVLRGVVLTLVAREREGQRRAPRPETRTIAIVPMHAEVPVGDFAHQLVDALAHYGTTRLVDPEEAGARAPGVFQGWLDGLEETHRFVVYLAEAEASEWSARCIRQADRVFLLAASHQDPRSVHRGAAPPSGRSPRRASSCYCTARIQGAWQPAVGSRSATSPRIITSVCTTRPMWHAWRGGWWGARWGSSWAEAVRVRLRTSAPCGRWLRLECQSI